MSDEDNDNIESVNDETEEVLNTEEVEETTPAVDTEDDDLVEKNKRLFERAKKAEAEVKKLKEQSVKQPPVQATPEKQGGITAMDAMALMGAKVTEQEDIEEVVEYATFKGIPVSEALKSTTVKTILAERAEQRTTALATNTGNARRGSNSQTSEQILDNAAKGKLPDDAEALAEARMQSKLKK